MNLILTSSNPSVVCPPPRPRCFPLSNVNSRSTTSPSPQGFLLLQRAISSLESSTTYQPRHCFKLFQHVVTPATVILPSFQHHRGYLKDYETEFHIISVCPFAARVWSLLPLSSNGQFDTEFFTLASINCQQPSLPSSSTVSCYVNGTWHILSLLTRIGCSNLTQGSASHRFISSVLMAEALTLKAAFDAASHFEYKHLTVFFDTQSLVSLIISFSDVNELKSGLVDIRCLLETFSSISLFYVPRSANVSADALPETVLSCLVIDYVATFA